MEKLINDEAFYKISAFKSQISGDAFFNQFPFFQLIANGQYARVVELGLNLLTECKYIDKKAYNSIHKGTPYYWMGMASFLSYDYVSATYYFDKALIEDIKNKDDESLQKSPSFLFVTLNDEIKFQAARDLVKNAKDTINSFVKIYNHNFFSTTKITLDQIRDGFFVPAAIQPNHSWRILITAFVSFFLEWNYRQTIINLCDEDETKETYFLHLYKGCLLFESLLKANTRKPVPQSPKYQTLGPILKYLKIELGLSEKNTKIGNTTFPKIVDELQTESPSIENYIELTGKIRNTIGHNLIWEIKIEKLVYEILFNCIALSCIHALALLYFNNK